MARPKKTTPAKTPAPAAVETAAPAVETAAPAVETAVPAVETAAPKQAAAKKPDVQKVEEIYLQAGGCEWNVSDCKERAVAAFVAEGHRASSVKKLVMYLKPEEGKAYYVINDSENGSIDL